MHRTPDVTPVLLPATLVRPQGLEGEATMRSAIRSPHLIYLCVMGVSLIAIVAALALSLRADSDRPALTALATSRATVPGLPKVAGKVTLDLTVAPATFGQNRFPLSVPDARSHAPCQAVRCSCDPSCS